jgi:hypothetical protein
MAETDEQRQVLFDQIEQRTFHVRATDDQDQSGADSDGDAFDELSDDEGGPARLPPHAYPSQEFLDRIHDKIIVMGINAFHLAVDRDLQRLLLDQTSRLVLPPSEVVHRVAERWMLKKLLDGLRATEAEDMTRPRHTQRRLVEALHLAQTLHLSSSSVAGGPPANPRSSGGGGGAGEGAGVDNGPRRELDWAEARRAMAQRAFDVYHDTIMSIAEQLVEIRDRKQLLSRKALLRIFSKRNILAGEDGSLNGGGGGRGRGGSDSSDDGGDDDGDSRRAAPANLHRCGRTSTCRMPAATSREAKAARWLQRQQQPSSNFRSWWRIDDDMLKWAPRAVGTKTGFEPAPYDWGPFERAYAVEWAFLQKAAAGFDAAVAEMDARGVDVFTCVCVGCVVVVAYSCVAFLHSPVLGRPVWCRWC